MLSKDSFSNKQPQAEDQSEFKVLVINSCQKMAKEITHELMQSFVGAAITYAPTFTLAKMIIAKRNFDLIVSSSRMPDGRVQTLQEILNSKNQPPPLVVIGDAKSPKGEMLGVAGYLFSSLRKIDQPQIRQRLESVTQQRNTLSQNIQDPIQNLGADLRNDLNNPLQEIVAMVYVAKSQNTASDISQEALEAITRAAKNLSSVVKGIEHKIRLAVAG